MRKTVWSVLMVFALSFGHLCYAQFGSSGPRFYTDFKPVVGGWSEYQITRKNGESSKMKIAIVGQEGDAYWYETVMEGGRQEGNIAKMLVSGNPGELKNVKRLIVKRGSKPAMEMPIGMMQQSAEQQSQQRKGNMIEKGTESITVPAGTFTVQHMQYQDGETLVDGWVYKDVSPYGVVKSRSKDFEMVLMGYGTGAKTLITETPKKFEMPEMPPRGK